MSQQFTIPSEKLAELESEQKWADLFSRTESEDVLVRLADEALAEHRAGVTRPIAVKHK